MYNDLLRGLKNSSSNLGSDSLQIPAPLSPAGTSDRHLDTSDWVWGAIMLVQEPITQREGALNFCMYADSTCCLIALAQNSLYGKCYVSAIIYLALV